MYVLPESITKALATLDVGCILLLQKYGIEIGLYPNMLKPISSDFNLSDHDFIPARKDEHENGQEFYDQFFKKWLTNYGDIIGLIGGCGIALSIVGYGDTFNT